MEGGWQLATIHQEHSMIKLTRLDGEAFILNADLIKYVEQRPDRHVAFSLHRIPSHIGENRLR